ncbi:glycosyltransferase [Agromyces sp. SYSU T00194]|uniref:glycosyltransferase n=1 Tax=Agromyces chitinivorans TaxID=3158560 RepID=UPI003398E041
MSTLQVVVDQLAAPSPGPLGRYAADLTRAVVAAAPAGWDVRGIVSATSSGDQRRIRSQLPGLAGLSATTLPRRELMAAWPLGMGGVGGMLHAPGLLAPLRRHEAGGGDQVVVTVHDSAAWDDPQSVGTVTAAWRKSTLKRARKHADAIIAPSHAMAERLLDFGIGVERIRVIGTAPRAGLELPSDQHARRRDLGLPRDGYAVVTGGPAARAGLAEAFTALVRPEASGLGLVVVGPPVWDDRSVEDAAAEHGLPRSLVRVLAEPEPADLASVLAGAVAHLDPSPAWGDATATIEALSLGVPVVHTDTPVLLETTAGAALVVERDRALPDRIASALARLASDDGLREQLAIAGSDRARMFTWQDVGERVWQLHADL